VPPTKIKSVQDYSGASPSPENPMDVKAEDQPISAQVISDEMKLTEDEKRLWRVRHESSRKYFKDSEHKGRMDRIRNVLDGKIYDDVADARDIQIPFPQHKIALKSRIPSLIYQDPEAVVEPDNDVVFEYDEAGQRKIDPQTGMPIKHDMTKVAKTLTALLKKKTTGMMFELRSALKYALAYNRCIFLIGHTINTNYEVSFSNDELFHPFLKSVSPYRIRRQPGTARISDGLYFFYDYQLPMSHLTRLGNINQTLLRDKCKPGIVEGISIDAEVEKLQANAYDDVKWLWLRNAYDLETGRVLVFGAGCDDPLWIAEPEYDFKNPSVEWIPNEQYTVDTLEPQSDLMDADVQIQYSLKLKNKLASDVMNYNHGLDIEAGAVDKKMRKTLERARNRALRVFKDQALVAGKVRERQSADIPQGALAVLTMMDDMIDKTLQSFDFMSAGSGKEEKATKTALKGQYASAGASDTASTFGAACNSAYEKFLHVCLKTTTENEVVKIVGDKGEVEYPEVGPEVADGIAYHVSVNLESARKIDSAVRVQQGTQLYEIVSKDPDPKIQKLFQKEKLLRKIAEALSYGDVIKPSPDTEGRSEEEYGAYLVQQHEKASMENQQAIAGAPVMPPAEDDDDDVHLADHMPVVAQAPNLGAHIKLHIDRKKMQEERATGEIAPPAMPQVSPNPPTAGQIQGQANKVAGAPPGLPQGAAGGEPTGGM